VSKNSRRLAPSLRQAGVEFVDQSADGDVQLGEREEADIAQPRQNPPLDDQHRRFDLGLGESRQMLVVSEQRWGKKSASRTSSIPLVGHTVQTS
jgi:hypothetical protein